MLYGKAKNYKIFCSFLVVIENSEQNSQTCYDIKTRENDLFIIYAFGTLNMGPWPGTI